MTSALLASVARAIDPVAWNSYEHTQRTGEPTDATIVVRWANTMSQARGALTVLCDHIAPEHPILAARLRREAGV